MKLSSTDRTIRQILSSYFFFIPRFQRPYSWNVDNVLELWEDSVQDAPSEYFIGSMVAYPTSEDTVSVIDGQQRLTTIIMLLSAIRDVAESRGYSGLANGTHGFIERKDENDVTRFALHTESSFPYLQDCVFSRGDAEISTDVGAEERAVQAAHGKLRDLVSSAVDAIDADTTIADTKRSEVAEDRLKSIRDRVLGLKVIFIEVGTEDDATTIFVTLNSRGKDLEPADLVKAHLLQLMPKKAGLDRPLLRWQGIIDLFDASEVQLRMTDFLLTVWQSRYETRVTGAKLTRAVRKRIKKENAPAFLKELETDARLYRQANEPTYRKWRKDENGAVQSLQFMRDFQIRQPMPLVLSLLRGFDAGHIKFKQLQRGLWAIENYHFSWNVIASKTSYGGMSAFFAKRAIDLHEAGGRAAAARIIDDLVTDLGKRRPSDAEFDEAFKALSFTKEHTSDRKVVFYILRRFYQHAHSGDATDFDKLTIEHLSSQSANVQGYGTLGNLVLVSKGLNNKVGSATFPKKIAAFRASSEWIPDDILRARSWTTADITKRTDAMAKAARTKIWK